MRLRTAPLIGILGLGVILSLLAAGFATSVDARSGGTAPRSGGEGQRAGGTAQRGTQAARASTPRSTAPRATAPAPTHRNPGSGATAPSRGHARSDDSTHRRTANGIARYGYGYGYGYPHCWGDCGWWGAGWYFGDGWGWPYYGNWAYRPYYAFWPYSLYLPYTQSYVAAVESPPPSGPVTIQTGITPSRAEVVLDGEMVGFAGDYNGRWDELSVAPGAHTIEFRKKGYRALVIAFDARPGASYAFSDELVPGEGEDRRELPKTAAEAPSPSTTPSPYISPVSPPAAMGRLRVRAEPSDAAVYLDGEYLGVASELGRIHAALAVATGSHRLEVVRPGYISASRAIDVGATETAMVEIILEPQR